MSEPLELRIKDILWAEGQLVVRAAKRAKDRRIPIPESLAAANALRIAMEKGSARHRIYCQVIQVATEYRF